MSPISFLNPLPPPQVLNSRFLSEEARLQIETLASQHWTDYNAHDPGITLMEVLAYAITDLGLRTQQPVENLIAGKDAKPFFTAGEVLPNAPLTERDYRRLLLNVKEPMAHNARSYYFVQDARLSPSGSYEGVYDVRLHVSGTDESTITAALNVRMGAEIEEVLVDIIPAERKELEQILQARRIPGATIHLTSLQEHVQRHSNPAGEVYYEASLQVQIEIPGEDPIEASLEFWVSPQIIEFEAGSRAERNFRTVLAQRLRQIGPAGILSLYQSLFSGNQAGRWYQRPINFRSGVVSYQGKIFIVPENHEAFEEVLEAGCEEVDLVIDPSIPRNNGVQLIDELGSAFRYFAELRVEDTDGEFRNVGVWIFPSQKEKFMKKKNRGNIAYEDAMIPLLRDIGPNGMWQEGKSRLERRKKRINLVREALHGNRNLCEDWGEFKLMEVQQISVCIECLELDAAADAEETLAQIYFALETFIEQPLSPQSLEELLEAGKSPDEIFLGSTLDRGYFSLEGLERDGNLYTSDLHSLIMQIPGIVGVRDLSLRLFIDRFEVLKDVRQCLSLFPLDRFAPQLSMEDCQIRLFRRGIEQEDIHPVDVQARLDQLRASRRAKVSEDAATDILIPQEKAFPFDRYFSIQRDFPRTYGLRTGEITADMPELRKAQAKQYKAFLMFFEQLLANYCSQLANFQQLFSINREVERTYFYQPLYQVPAVKELYTDYLTSQNEVVPPSWEEFQGMCNQYLKTLNFAAEDQPAFRERREQFVDHLLARFGESFADYASWVYLQNRGNPSSDLLLDKLDFLQQFPALSANRAKAFDYTEDAWETNNVSGYLKRVSALMGIPDSTRRSLYQPFDIEDYLEVHDEQDRAEDGLREARIRFWNRPVNEVYAGIPPADRNEDTVDRSHFVILLSSTRHYVIGDELEEEADQVVEFGKQGQHYVVRQTDSTRAEVCEYRANLLDDSFDVGDPIARLQDYPTNRAIVEEEIRKVIYLMQGRHVEGFHLIEHILLRSGPDDPSPLHPYTPRFSVGSEILEPFIPDPYEFQLSIFIPTHSTRMQEKEFQVILERILREEMPVHLYPWIYWVSFSDSDAEYYYEIFETALREWCQAMKETSSDLPAKRESLILAMNDLHEYGYAKPSVGNAYYPYDSQAYK